MAYGDFEPIIGLEIHAQLKTKSKLFSSDAAIFGAGDNENISEISLGHPGTLPVMNRSAVECAIKVGLALNCKIASHSVMARKNYFYPDLPKGYQISQYEEPICQKGSLRFVTADETHEVQITRAHLEEDAGKSTHHGNYSLLNFNRAGVPLLEIVSEPEIQSPQEAADYARAMRSVLVYLGVCDGNLEEGSFRCDCNVSVRRKGQEKLGTKVEIKNLNSFRFIEKAIEYEIQRQIECLQSGERIVQETRLYDVTKNRTFTMREKEEAHDYRYFPDPDLLPVPVNEKWIETVRSTMPELPLQRMKRFIEELGLPQYDSHILTQEKELADYFEIALKESGAAKATSNWIMGETLRRLNESGLSIGQAKIKAEDLGLLVKKIEGKELTPAMAKSLFQKAWSTGESLKKTLSQTDGLKVIGGDELNQIVDHVLSQHVPQVDEYLSGKEKVFGFLMGQVMRAAKGQASPDDLKAALLARLKK
jgi:aspartyl-tRNA(Asn)/glutamyl-tRNA(Gln) amidotransferase subunit B